MKKQTSGTISLRQKLYRRADEFAHKAYRFAKLLPREELFCLGSQIRRATVSVPCNIIEGFARDDSYKSKKELLRFTEIAHGSLEEVKYLIKFSQKEYNLNENIENETLRAAEHLGKLLFAFILKLREHRT